RWTGLNVIDTYPRPDALTAQMSAHLVDLGKAENVTLVIDNLQSGADGGKAIAEDIGCARIVLSNFPGGFDNTETWEKAIDHNIDLILEAVTK
ncbi:MAG: zinc ABC transporter substrate-binding protein, partial [Chloroflexi bacterium]